MRLTQLSTLSRDIHEIDTALYLSQDIYEMWDQLCTSSQDIHEMLAQLCTLPQDNHEMCAQLCTLSQRHIYATHDCETFKHCAITPM